MIRELKNGSTKVGKSGKIAQRKQTSRHKKVNADFVH